MKTYHSYDELESDLMPKRHAARNAPTPEQQLRDDLTDAIQTVIRRVITESTETPQ